MTDGPNQTSPIISLNPMVNQIHQHVASDVIITTEDKIRLILLTRVKYIEQRRGWIAPLTLLVSLVTTLFTTSFNAVFLEPSAWKAIFLICAGISGVWLLISIYYACKSEPMDNIIEEFKKGP